MFGLTSASRRLRRIFSAMFDTIAKWTGPWSERPSLRTALTLMHSQRLWRYSSPLTRSRTDFSLRFELYGRLIRNSHRNGTILTRKHFKNVLELKETIEKYS